MDKSDFRSRDGRRAPAPPCTIEGGIQYVLKGENELLQAISARAPVPQILNDICSALDCQIGNIVSLISLLEDDPGTVSEMAWSASHFGLHIFSSAGIAAEGGELLGSLEMYSCCPRNPSTREIQWIERAACLAAIAIGRDKEAGKAAREAGREPVQTAERVRATGFLN